MTHLPFLLLITAIAGSFGFFHQGIDKIFKFSDLGSNHIKGEIVEVNEFHVYKKEYEQFTTEDGFTVLRNFEKSPKKIKPLKKIAEKKFDFLGDITSFVDKKVSSTVLNAISREKLNSKIERGIRDKINFNFSSIFKKKNANTIVEVRAFDVVKNSVIQNSELTNVYNPYQAEISDHTGKIKLSYNLAGNNSSILYNVVSKNFLPVIGQSIIESGQNKILVPMISIEKIDEVAKNHFVDTSRGFVLVKLSNEIEDLELDSTYSKRIFFDKRLNVVQKIDQSGYCLFFGVKEGTALLSYLTRSDDVVDKLIFVKNKNLTYDFPEFEREKITMLVYERNIIGKKNKLYNLNIEDIRYFNRKEKFRKNGIGKYSLLLKNVHYNQKHYIEFNTPVKNTFSTIGYKNTIAIPSVEYFNQILMDHDLDNLNGNCLIELNLSSKPKSIEFESLSEISHGYLNVKYYDKDGTFGNEITDNVDKVFISGNSFGIVDIKIENTKGEVELAQSFCSVNSYLLEHF